MPMPQPTIECWFDFASTYSYLSVLRLEAAAAAKGVEVAWKPMLLGEILREQGWTGLPFPARSPKARYMWAHDLPRECRRYGLPVIERAPSVFPRSAVLPLRVALLGAERRAAWTGEFCRRVMQVNFIADRDIEPADTVREVLLSMALPADELLDAARTEQHKQRLREQTAQAMDKGVFGAPTFFVGEAMFWGNDRLDEALALAAAGG